LQETGRRRFDERETHVQSWFENATYRFQRRVLKDAAQLAQAFTAPGALFEGLSFEGKSSIFHTNTVKVYVPEAEGKRADQLSNGQLVGHADQWHEELVAMASSGAMPHLVLVFGASVWQQAWEAFYVPLNLPVTKQLAVTGYRPGSGAVKHALNRISCSNAGAPHELLLIRVRHPAARRREYSTRWLLASPDFRSLAGLPVLG
jgi:hypothetical protein